MFIIFVLSAMPIMAFSDPISPGYPRKRVPQKSTNTEHLLYTRNCAGHIL